MYFEDIEVNTEIDIAPAVIEKDKMLDFARLYDNIPLHTDEEYAKPPLSEGSSHRVLCLLWRCEQSILRLIYLARSFLRASPQR